VAISTSPGPPLWGVDATAAEPLAFRHKTTASSFNHIVSPYVPFGFPTAPPTISTESCAFIIGGIDKFHRNTDKPRDAGGDLETPRL
jgi:hypothetical protein